MKFCSIDIETTGLDEDTCDIIEFGAILDDLVNPLPIRNLPKFHCYFVKDSYVGEPGALMMHSKTFQRINDRESPYTYMSASKLGYSFKCFLMNNGYKEERQKVTINVAGKNFGIFDYHFLKRKTDLLKHVNIRHNIVDPTMLYVKTNDEFLPGLTECKKRAGIGGDVTHTAIDDAMDVVKLLRAHYGV